MKNCRRLAKGNSHCGRLLLTPTFRASGSVYVGRSTSTQELVAMKQIDLNQQPRKHLIYNELEVMKEARHPNIVNYVDGFLSGHELWVLMEYMKGGALTDVIDANTLTESQIAAICLEVIRPAAPANLPRPARGLSICTTGKSSIATSRATTCSSVPTGMSS